MKKLCTIIFLLVLIPGVLMGCSAAKNTAAPTAPATSAAPATLTGVRARIIGHWVVLTSQSEGKTHQDNKTTYDFTADKVTITLDPANPITAPYSWIDNQTISLGGSEGSANMTVSFDNNGHLLLSGNSTLNGAAVPVEITLEKQ